MSLFYEKILRPIAFRMDAETAHERGLAALRVGLGTAAARRVFAKQAEFDGFGAIERFGLRFRNPLGMAAGFDKNGIVIDQLAALGFGFVEVGTVTARPQPGNEKPRMFRLPADKALINRLGFNNEGAAAIARNVSGGHHDCVVGINIGKNRDVPVEEAVENYLECFDAVYNAADYIALNISSPNTPGLRELQKGESFAELVGALQRRNAELSNNSLMKPLLVKIAPDLSETELGEIVKTAVSHQAAGFIATNTTISRDGLTTPGVAEIGAGGLSGAPLTRRSTEVIASLYRFTKGRVPIIGVGGIMSAQDAFDKIAAGASLLQTYTGFVYGGPSFAAHINTGLEELLDGRGFGSLDEAVGSAVQGEAE
jgi:dihydroorotate dehydrogenase